jgi:hypothetical protein
MAALLTCRICGKQEVVEDGLLSDVCESCTKKAVERHQQIFKEGDYGGENNADSSAGSSVSGPERKESQFVTRAGGAGDAVEKVTRFLGISSCGSCSKRKEAMNRVDLSGPAKDVFLGLAKAILTPDKK